MTPRQTPSAWSSVASALGKDKSDAAPEAPSSPWSKVAEKLGGPSSEPAPAPEVEPEPEAEPEPVVDDEPEPVDEAPDEPEKPAARRAPRPRAERPRADSPGPRIANPRRFFSVVGGAVVVVVLLVIGLVVWPGVGGGGLSGNVALRYDGKNVTKAQINGIIPVLQGYYGYTIPNKSDKKAYDTFLGTAAKAYVIDQIVTKQAAAHGVTVTDAQADGGVSTQALTQLAKTKNLTLNQVQTELRLNVLQDKLVAKVAPTGKPSSDQINQTYQANRSALGKPETRAVSRILVTDLSSAQTIITDLQQGQSFATLAGTYSEDTSTKSSGGQIGTLAQSLMSADFGKAAFAAQLNVPFGPVSEGTTGAYDVGLVTAINPASPATLDATTSGVVTKYLGAQVQSREWNTFMRGQLSGAKVRYAHDYEPDQPLTPPSLPVPSLSELMAQAVSQSAGGSS